MRKLVLLLLAALPLGGDTLPFISDKEIAALASEVSGETAKRNLEGLARQHRMRGSRGFRNATDLVIAELKRYGYADAHVESFPTDGKSFYGTQRSRPAWNAEFAELWEVDGNGAHGTRIASWEASPISLAQDSVSADVTAELIDVGAGSATRTSTSRRTSTRRSSAAPRLSPPRAGTRLRRSRRTTRQRCRR